MSETSRIQGTSESEAAYLVDERVGAQCLITVGWPVLWWVPSAQTIFTRKVYGSGRVHQLHSTRFVVSKQRGFPVERVDFVLLPSRRDFGGT